MSWEFGEWIYNNSFSIAILGLLLFNVIVRYLLFDEWFGEARK